MRFPVLIILVLLLLPAAHSYAAQGKKMSSIPPAMLVQAQQGDAESQTSIGAMYEKGDDVKQDYVAAAKWYRKAADQGDADAQYWLGQLYRKGQGVKQNNAEAYFWELVAEKSDNTGDPYVPDHAYYAVHLSAAKILAIKKRAQEWKPTRSPLEEGRVAYAHKDYQTAFKLLQPLAKEGNTEAQSKLANMHRNGWGVAKNGKEAEKWTIASKQSLLRSAEEGDQLAQMTLCIMYLRGAPDVKNRTMKKLISGGAWQPLARIVLVFRKTYMICRTSSRANKKQT